MKTNTQSSRYKVAVWHGEAGSIFRVVDTKKDRVMGETSTFRDKGAARELADIQCNALNKADKHSTPTPNEHHPINKD